jgi:hypothetical protein
MLAATACRFNLPPHNLRRGRRFYASLTVLALGKGVNEPFCVSSRRISRKWDDFLGAIAIRIRNMSAEAKREIQLEIVHVLFIDIVGCSELSINEQQAAVDELTQIVRVTEQFQKAETADRLIKIPSGHGMALVFYTSPGAPVRCGMELSRTLKDQSRSYWSG